MTDEQPDPLEVLEVLEQAIRDFVAAIDGDGMVTSAVVLWETSEVVGGRVIYTPDYVLATTSTSPTTALGLMRLAEGRIKDAMDDAQYTGCTDCEDDDDDTP